MKSTILLSLFCLTLTAASANDGVGNLTVEGRNEPMGIDIAQPRFGWVITSDKRNVMQRSYHITVSTTADGTADVWDSGSVMSDSSQWVAYKGKPLQPNTQYFWSVKVTTNKGKKAVVASSRWTTGLMTASNWRGHWIGLDSMVTGDKAERHSRLVARCLRKTFGCKDNIKRATMHISGVGLYTLYINSQRVGDGVLTPVPTDYEHTVAYDTYDVTHLLKRRNAIGVTLEGGHYFAQTQNYDKNTRKTYGLPRMIANLIIEYDDGTTQTVATDETWKLSTDGPVRYANEYDGELFDARLAKDFSAPSFDDTYWQHADSMASPKGTLRGNITPPMTVYATDEPATMKTYGQRTIVDFATNGAGRIALDIKANSGDTIRIRHAELLESGDSTLYTQNLRSAEATAWFVSDGTERTWKPDFTFYGFRYAEITTPVGATVRNIRRELIADQMDTEGNAITFYGDSDAERLNKIVGNAVRGIRSNYKGMPIDCPQRDERMPWLGDRTTGSTGESYIVNNYSLYTKWLADIRDSQHDDGGISDVSPAYWQLYRTNVTWPAALPFCADMLYRQYGDLRPMRDSYDAIKKWLNLVETTIMKDGLVTYDRYGDWCVPPEKQNLVHSKDPARKTDGALLSSTYYYYLCTMMERYAKMFGNDDEAIDFHQKAETTRTSINRKFLVNGSYSNGTATANILPLAMNIVTDSCRAAVEQSLINTIVDKNDSHISCGVVGIQWIMRLLTNIGSTGLAFRMATTPTYPGWGYMVEQGATTIWELWNGNTANPSMNSGNHVMLLGDLLPWCFEYLGGISTDNIETGFKRIVLCPDFTVSALDGVEASHRSPYGQICSSWRRTADGIVWSVTVPANTQAEIYLPDGNAKTIGSGNYTFKVKGKKK